MRKNKQNKISSFQKYMERITKLKRRLKYVEPTIEWDEEWGYGFIDYNGNIAELYAPTDMRGNGKLSPLKQERVNLPC